MTRNQLVSIWRDATGLPFHPGSATERGLRAVLEAVADEISITKGDYEQWVDDLEDNLRTILDDQK